MLVLMDYHVEHDTPTVLRRHDIPARVSAADAFDPPDYVDLFVARTTRARDASPEEWARAAMEGANPVGRFLAWQTVLGLRLAGGGEGHIAGWRIAQQTDDWIRVEASSWFMTAHIVFLVDDDTVSFATSVRYDRPSVAGVVWPAVAVIHRAVAPGFLLGGVHRVLRSRRLPHPAAH
jgi:hypothetical protein